ncbi:MAG: DUF362 domain-containing protein [candidate division Zixibacteria bacterium]|nr:DUF362 domain-containing protein [candidate division Zixibacteria bacterium]
MPSTVAVLKTSPGTVFSDYAKLMRMVGYQNEISKEKETILKLNLSWDIYFPSSSSQPWQLEGVVRTLLEDEFDRGKLLPVENKTVVTDPIRGAEQNCWFPVLNRYGLSYTPLPSAEWVKYDFKRSLLKLNQIFPEGIEIPRFFIGKQIIHLPTVKTHGHSVTTGAIKNSFGGLLKEVRHFAHKHIHEVLVDLMMMQKELHPGIFAVMDGTVCGNGAGPRTMIPVIKNYILASSDQVAIDSVAARMMGFDPLRIPYLKMCAEMGLGQADLRNIQVIGEDISGVNFKFEAKKSFVIWGDQMLRKGSLQFMEKAALHSPLAFWAPVASNLYHDLFWYPVVGKRIVDKFLTSDWGQFFESYRSGLNSQSSRASA